MHIPVRRFKGTDKIYLILWFFLAVYPLIVIPNPLGYSSTPRYFLLALVALSGLFTLVRQRPEIHKHPAFVPLGLFILFSLISAILAPDPLTAWIGLFGEMGYFATVPKPHIELVQVSRFTGFSTYFFCVILFILAFQVKRSERFLKPMLITAAIVSFLALLQHFGLNIVPRQDSMGRWVSGTMGNPNFLGTYTVFFLPAAILSYLFDNKKRWLFAGTLIYCGLLVSLTRGAWLAFGVVWGIIAFYCIKNQHLGKYFLKFTIVLLVVTLLLMPTRDGIIFKRLYTIPGELESGVRLEQQAGSNRMHIWEESVKLIPSNWAFGIGPDHLIYAGIKASPKTLADKAHNIFLEIAVTMGLLALVSYLAFLSFFWRPPPNKPGFIYFTMIIAYLFQGLFNIDVVMVMPVFWIVLGMSLGSKLCKTIDSRT